MSASKRVYVAAAKKFDDQIATYRRGLEIAEKDAEWQTGFRLRAQIRAAARAARAMAGVFEMDNPRFDRDRWFAAAGLDSEGFARDGEMSGEGHPYV